jgi:hypothetical protein
LERPEIRAFLKTTDRCFWNLGLVKDQQKNFELDSKKQQKTTGISSKGQEDQDASFKETKALVDDGFLHFQARISRAPTQVLRSENSLHVAHPHPSHITFQKKKKKKF